VSEMLVGLLGIVVGALVSELMRRRVRIETYSSAVFEKRLAIYEELYRRIRHAGEVGDELFENRSHNPQQRHALVSAVVLDIAGYTDEQDMYVNEEVAIHCTSLLMGIENASNSADDTERKQAQRQFHESLMTAKRMIRKESGVADLDALFRSITKAKHSSPIISYYHQQMKAMGKKGKWEAP
jgi:hypothetical protein